jgi:hypothetical protein
MVTVILSYFCENLTDKWSTDTNEIKFLKRKIRHAFTDEVRDHNILINLDILNVKRKTADRKMNVL